MALAKLTPRAYTDSAKQYGFDPVMYYLDFRLPKFAELGTNVRVGRYISIPDIEAQLAPNVLANRIPLLRRRHGSAPERVDWLSRRVGP
jgi:hypothetical protein